MNDRRLDYEDEFKRLEQDIEGLKKTMLDKYTINSLVPSRQEQIRQRLLMINTLMRHLKRHVTSPGDVSRLNDIEEKMDKHKEIITMSFQHYNAMKKIEKTISDAKLFIEGFNMMPYTSAISSEMLHDHRLVKKILKGYIRDIAQNLRYILKIPFRNMVKNELKYLKGKLDQYSTQSDMIDRDMRLYQQYNNNLLYRTNQAEKDRDHLERRQILQAQRDRDTLLLQTQINKNITDAATLVSDYKCYVLIQCHGGIDMTTTDPVPLGKVIYKKNKAHCGFVNIGEFVGTVERDTDFYFNFPRYADLNIPICSTERTLELYNMNRMDKDNELLSDIGLYPNLRIDHVMCNKIEYYRNIYQISHRDVVTGNTRNPYFGITLYIRNPDNTYSTYNIMRIDEWISLMDRFRPYIQGTDESRRVKFRELYKNPMGPTKETIKNKNNAPFIHETDTQYLFQLFDILPFTEYLIYDLSCRVVIDPDPKSDFIHPTLVHYDYSEHNPYGLGGSVKYNRTHRKKQSNLKHTYKYGKRSNHINRAGV